MTANLDILTNYKEGALIVPQQAIIEKNGDKTVSVLDKGKIQEIKISTGLKGDGGMIEVSNHLKEGQGVVTFVENGQ
jgi:multidrug efflux pump subunit AcrA (membrane-fusion protein)